MAQPNFMAKVSEIEMRDGIPRFEAMSKARREFPAEFEAYQAPIEIEPAQPDPAQLAKASSLSAFQSLARGIADRERIDMASAMSKARVRHPDEFEAAYS